MLVLNCPNDFHEKYYSNSTNQVFQSIPIFKKKTSFFDENEDENNENINNENTNPLRISKKKSSDSDNRNSIKKKKLMHIELMSQLKLKKMKD